MFYADNGYLAIIEKNAMEDLNYNNVKLMLEADIDCRNYQIALVIAY